MPGAPAGFGNRRRQAVRDVFLRILQRAKEWPADAVLIAGDLLDYERASRDTVVFLQEEFKRLAPIPVFLAPGNHDPYTVISPYATEEWPSNVTIFHRSEWTAHALAAIPLTVHGFGFDGPDISVNPFGNLQIPRDDRVHVAVGHGTAMGSAPSEMGAYAPFSPALAADHRLAYLALGHFHGMKAIEAPFGTVMYYSGAPEGHGFNECGLHYFLEVELDAGRVQVNPVPSCQSLYEVYTVDCSAFVSKQQAIDAIRALAPQDGRSRIARIWLTGSCADAWRGEALVIRDSVAPLFEYLDLVDELEPAEDFEMLARDETSLGVFVRRMLKESDMVAEPAKRRMLARALEVGVAAFRDRPLPIRGAGGE